ncbi:unnamed protein product, partial [Amoebophrya sp. A120]|eukprot:GSA120T00014722001.1
MPSMVVDLQNRGSGRGVLPNPARWSRFVVPGKSTAKIFLSVVALLHQLTSAAALFSSLPGRSGSRSRRPSGGASSRGRAGDAVHTSGASVVESGAIFMAQQHAAPEDFAGSATDTASSSSTARNINQATQHGERGGAVQSGGQDEGAVARPVLEITH